MQRQLVQLNDELTRLLRQSELDDLRSPATKKAFENSQAEYECDHEPMINRLTGLNERRDQAIEKLRTQHRN